MECPGCGAANKQGRRFCGSCGAGLPAPCPSCEFLNDATDRFCGGCGRDLRQDPQASGKPAPGPRAPAPPAAKLSAPAPAPGPARDPGEPTHAAQRRHLTIMFCDLVGSTALSTRMDPEDLRELITSFQSVCEAEVKQRDGFVARYMGDGLLVYFGYPRAHERDAERAVEAALGIVEACKNIDVEVRVGIATGISVVGDLIGEGASGEAAVVGQTPNLAARLQGLAAANAVVISPATRRLVHGRFELESLGPQVLKGFDDPVEAYRVVGRAHHDRSQSLAPLVGRERELDLLRERWETARTGEGQVVVLSSEAGLGKSRLVTALLESVKADGHPVVRLEGAELLSTTALAPLVEWLRRTVTETVDGPATYAAVEAAVPGPDNGDRREAIANLLGLDTEDASLRTLPPATRRERVAAALAAHLEEVAGREPTVVVFEDLHWADPASLDVLGRLVRRCGNRGVLVILTRRPGPLPEWADLPHVTRLHLGKLSRAQTTSLIESLSPKTELAAKIVDSIIGRADGVPLFVEELTRGVLESETLSIPSTLQESLLARLDRSPQARDVAQLAAVLGRDFTAPALAAVSGRSLDDLREPLQELTRGNILIDHEDNRYSFRHALLRDVAYDSLLRASRRAHHLSAARALADAGSPGELQPELVAHHFTEGGDLEQAVAWWRRAAKRAEVHSGATTSLLHLDRARALLGDTREGPGATLRVEVEIDRANCMRTLDRLPEALESVESVEPLAVALGSHAILTRLWFVRGNLLFWLDPTRCEAAHERALEEARLAHSEEAEARALGGLADAAFLRGAISTSRDRFARCIELARTKGYMDIAADNGPMLCTTTIYTHGPRAAVELGQAAVEAARAARRPRAHVMAHVGKAVSLTLVGEASQAIELIEQALRLSETYGITMLYSAFVMARARAELVLDHRGDAQASAESVLGHADSTGGNFFAPIAHILLARATRDPKPLDDALEAMSFESWHIGLEEFVPTFLEAACHLSAWDHVDRILALFEPVSPAEPIFMLNLYVDGARCIAELARERVDPSTLAELTRVRDEARRVGLVALEQLSEDRLPPA